MKEDFDFFSPDNKVDVVDTLSTEDENELINMVSEPFGEDTLSQSELDDALRQWRINNFCEQLQTKKQPSLLSCL